MVKKITYLLIPIFIFFLVVIFFSEKTTKYECIGKFQRGNHEVTLFIKLIEYRWWVHLWSDSDGMIHYEIPGKFIDSSTNIKKYGDQIQVIGNKNELKGYFSKLSKFISITTYSDIFEGSCKGIN